MLQELDQHPHARAVLDSALKGEPSHAYLLYGPGDAKRRMAREFAAELLAAGQDDAAAVRERVLRGTHPDLTWVTPSGAHELLRADIDEPVVLAATRTPFEADRRVFVIERAETMNDEAANRLLKTLEEPADYVHLVLLASGPEDVLPTIRSRCQLVRFEPIGTERLAEELVSEGAETELATATARLSGGDQELARLLVGESGAALRTAALKFGRTAVAGELVERPWLELLETAKRAGTAAAEQIESALEQELELVSKKDRKRVQTAAAERAKRARRRAESATLDLALRLVVSWYRDLLCLAYGSPELAFNSDRRDDLEADASAVTPQVASAAIALVEETRTRIELNVGTELAFEALAYRIEKLAN